MPTHVPTAALPSLGHSAARAVAWRSPAIVSRPPLDRRWDLLLALVATYLLVAVGRVHQLVPGLEVIRPALLTGALAIALYLPEQRGIRRVGLTWKGPTRYLAGLVAWMVLCIPTALVTGASVLFVVQGFAKTALMVFVIAGCIRGTRDVERLAGAYFASAALYSVMALVQYRTGEEWRLGHLFYYDANDLAAFLATAVPFGIYFFYASRRASMRVAAAAGLLLIAIAFVSTGSRGGLLAMAAVLGFIVIRYTAIPLRVRVGATLLMAATVMLAATDQYWSQMGTIFEEDDYNWTEETGRVQIWSRGLGYMMARPLFGVGPDNFGAAEGTISDMAKRQQLGFGVRWSNAHNAFVQAGAELGVPGLLLFVAMIVSTFRMLRRYRRQALARKIAEARPDLSQAITASLLGFVVGAFFLSFAYQEMLYALIAIAVGLVKTMPRVNRVRTPWSGDVHA